MGLNLCLEGVALKKNKKNTAKVNPIVYQG
jgi:hypothetical protein